MRRAAAVVATFAVVAAACSSEPAAPTGDEPRRGGVYRTAVPDLGLTDNLDPTGEYGSVGWLVYTGMLRTLLTYRHVGGPEGNEPVPDLAEAMPEVSPDGLTYTFELKDGVRFGPPLDRPITARDVAYAFERIDTASLIAQYGQFYDGTIVGMDGPHDGEPSPISGIETPDDRTIVFHLTQPTGDFPYRVTLPATAPIPEEVARCFLEAGAYGRHLIASGPYMLAGSDALDASTCDAMEPIDGFDPTEHLVLVRNPSYDPGTDDPAVRANHLDGVEITINTNVGDIFDKIRAGELEGSLNAAAVPPDVLEEYASDPELEPYLHVDEAEFASFVTMNLAEPPFDDVHVRRAANLAIDKRALLQIQGGPLHGRIATHVFPDVLLPDLLDGYDPYPSADHAGDLERAREEMRLSAYDADGDGSCDDAACQGMVMVGLALSPFTEMNLSVAEDLAAIGIDVDVRELEFGAAYHRLSDPTSRIPLSLFGAYGKDYADPYSFARVFSSASIQPAGNVNFSLVGLSPDTAEGLGIPYPDGGVPSVDADIEACQALAGDERATCWAALDRRLMEEVVPWIPYTWMNVVSVTGPSVTHYEFDQFSGNPSITHIAVDDGLAPNA